MKKSFFFVAYLILRILLLIVLKFCLLDHMEFQRKKSNLKCKGLVFVILSFILVKFAENFVFAISFVSFVSKTLNLPQTTRFGQSLIKDNK